MKKMSHQKRSRNKNELGILFLHHTCNAVTQHNLQSIRQQNPKSTIVTMSADVPLPGGYTLNDTPQLKKLHSELPQRREDLLVCSWFLQKREKCDKWWIVEWDLYCEIPVKERYKDVWHYPFVAPHVCLLYRHPCWYWFQQAKDVPVEYEPYVMGALPFVFLMSEVALESTCRMLIEHPFLSANSELRFATAANRCGYAPCGFSPPNDRVTWIAWEQLTGPRNVFHPVKHIVDYR